jgi:hypothetical protein
MNTIRFISPSVITRLWIGRFLLVALFAESPALKAQTNDPKTVEIMDSIFDSIRTLLPLSFDPVKFQSKKNQKLIGDNLDKMAASATKLDSHGKSLEPGFRYMSSLFSADVSQIRDWYNTGRYDGARFYLHNLVDRCVECHSKLESRQNFPRSHDFFKNVDTKSLPITELARLQVATRQFDAALDTYEKFFQSPGAAREIGFGRDVFTDYLKISLRVKRDFSRPNKAFESFLKRKDVPAYLMNMVKIWTQDLTEISAKKMLDKKDVDTAKKAIEFAKSRMDYPTDRSGLVYYTLASAILQTVVKDLQRPEIERAEAYYYLGITELMLTNSLWASGSQPYFESAIRMAPSAPFARDAYAIIEEQVYLAFTGSSGVHLPEDLRKWLEELKKFVEKNKRPE